MNNSKQNLIGDIALIAYGVLLFVRISLLKPEERDGFDIFQWILGPVIVLITTYRVIKRNSRK